MTGRGARAGYFGGHRGSRFGGAADHRTVLRTMRRQHFAVLSTSDADGRPASAGVTYGLSPSGTVIWVMTRRHLQKARNIVNNPPVSIVIPVPRRLLWAAPPATIQLHGRARIVDWTDPDGRGVFSRFLLGRQIISGYEKQHRQGEDRICFLRIELDPDIHTYLVGTSVWRAHRDMESASMTVRRP